MIVKQKQVRFLFLLIALLLSIAGCGDTPMPQSQPTLTVAEVSTPTDAPMQATATPVPPTATIPTHTPAPTRTHTPTPTPCVLDVQLVDVQEIYNWWHVNSKPRFDLVLRNTGACAWPMDTRLALATETGLGWPDSWDVGSVDVGNTEVIHIQVQAPSEPETFHIVWRLQDSDGNPFGGEVSYDLIITWPPTPTPTPTSTPTPVPRVELPPEQIMLDAPCERCTTLRWNVENVKAIYLDDEGVVGNGSREVCLEQEDKSALDACYYQWIDYSYLFRVVTEGRNIERSVTVSWINPECQAYLGASSFRVNRGECATLRWSIDDWDYFQAVIDALYLNGQQVPHEGSQEVCPAETQTYTLSLATRCGNVDYQLTIEVKQP